MSKQRCISITLDELVDLLKEKLEWLPADLEICSIERVQRTNIIAIMVHSDEFKPLKRNVVYPIRDFDELKIDGGWL
jgi:hypothetical protein